MYEALRSWQEQEYESLNTSNITLTSGEVQEARELEKEKGIHVKRRSLSPPSGSPRKQQNENSTFHRKKVAARPMSNGFLNIQVWGLKLLMYEALSH